jgi:hypothetical protein
VPAWPFAAGAVVAGNRADLVRVWNVITDGFGGMRPPSTLLGVAMLGCPDQLVEIEAAALWAEDARTPDSAASALCKPRALQPVLKTLIAGRSPLGI